MSNGSAVGMSTSCGRARHPHEAPADNTVRPSRNRRTLVIGLGNPLVSDDSVGLRVAAVLRQQLAEESAVDVTEDYWGGLRLMERMIGYDQAIVIDAICTGAEPGTIHYLSTEMMPTQKSTSAHDVNLATALDFGRRAGAHVPDNSDVHLVGIEAQDVINFSDQCTPSVAAAIPRAAAQVVQLLESLKSNSGASSLLA